VLLLLLHPAQLRCQPYCQLQCRLRRLLLLLWLRAVLPAVLVALLLTLAWVLWEAASQHLEVELSYLPGRCCCCCCWVHWHHLLLLVVEQTLLLLQLLGVLEVSPGRGCCCWYCCRLRLQLLQARQCLLLHHYCLQRLPAAVLPLLLHLQLLVVVSGTLALGVLATQSLAALLQGRIETPAACRGQWT
jgi:flagellar biosynthesis protein FliQ